MKAEEMFEKLGYKKFEYDKLIIYKKIENDHIFKIKFILKETKYNSKIGYYYVINHSPGIITRELHKAINKQYDELGWL